MFKETVRLFGEIPIISVFYQVSTTLIITVPILAERVGSERRSWLCCIHGYQHL